MTIDISELETFVPYEEPRSPSKIRSVVGAPVKAFSEEGGREVRKVGKALGSLFGLDEKDLGMPTEEEADVRLEELFPTQEGTGERVLERIGKLAPYGLMGGGSVLMNLLRTGLGGAFGQGVEELGGGPISQFFAEMLGFGAPDLKKVLQPSGKQKQLVEGGRRIGLSEKEITPLVQGELKQKMLGPISKKSGRIAESLVESKKGLQTAYKSLAEGGTAKTSVKMPVLQNIDSQISRKFDKLPLQAQEKILPAYRQYLNSPKTGEDLIKFYGEINRLYPTEQSAQVFKDPILKGLNSISKDLGEDFKIVNNLYSKFYKTAARLKPNLMSSLLDAGEVGALAHSVLEGNLSGIQKILGVGIGREVATQFLTNPRLQNIMSKFVSALNQNKPVLARELFGKIITNISQKNPKAAQELRKIDLKDLNEVKDN